MIKIKAYFLRWENFLLCFLRGDCKYSIKKLLVILSFIVVAYLAVFTDKQYIDLLVFIAALLGIRSWDKMQYRQQINKTPDENLG